MRDVTAKCKLGQVRRKKALNRRKIQEQDMNGWVGGRVGKGRFKGLETAPEKRSLCSSLGTYLTHEAKGSDDAPDADTAIINAEGGQSGGDDKKEYFI